jgi:hypothetical protein
MRRELARTAQSPGRPSTKVSGEAIRAEKRSGGESSTSEIDRGGRPGRGIRRRAPVRVETNRAAKAQSDGFKAS